MQSEYELPFRVPTSPTPLVICALIQLLSQGFGVNLEHEDCVEQIYELHEIARAPAEEGHHLALIIDERFDPVDVPDVVMVDCEARDVGWFTGLRIALIGQVSITVNGLISTSAQLLTHRSLTCSGTALYEEVSSTHG